MFGISRQCKRSARVAGSPDECSPRMLRGGLRRGRRRPASRSMPPRRESGYAGFARASRLVMILGLVCASPQANGGPSVADLQQSLEWRHQMMRTVVAEATVREHPTDMTQVPRIAEAVRKLGGDYTVERYITSAELASSRAHDLRWWRAGPRVRSESSPVVEGTEHAAQDQVVVFDGVLVRELSGPLDGRLGAIHTAEGAKWNRAHRLTFVDFLYEDHGVPFANRLSEARASSLGKDTIDGKEYLLVEMQSSLSEGLWHRLWTTPDGIVRRFDTEMALGNEPRRLFERWEYLAYADFLDASGETIEYPTQVLYRACLGKLDDGEPVEYWTDEYRIRKINFNQELPDELFTLEFPPGTKIYDGVNGYGYLAEPEQVSAVVEFTPDPRIRWREWAWGLAIGLGGAVVGVWWWWRHAKRVTAIRHPER